MSTPTTVVVSLSHDGSNWTDVSAYVDRRGLSFQRGRSRVLDEWQPGTFSFSALNQARAIDPTNDSATFQPRPGDEVKVAVNGTTRWRGRIDRAAVDYRKAGTTPDSTLSLSGSDGLATLARATVTDLASAVAGYGTYYTGALIDLVLALSDLNYANAATTDTGDVATSLPDTGTLNALQVVQSCTRTEGGNAQLFTLKDGTLRWRSRYARPSQVVTFGGSGIPIHDVQVDYSDDAWSNLVNITTAQHVDYQSSVTSVTTGTGTKNFTLDALPSSLADGFGFSAGAAVYIESDGAPSNNMTGTVTSFNETTRALVTSIASKNGTATRTDWTLTFTEPTSTQSASDAQSRAEFREYRTGNVSTYHRNATAAATEATLLAAQRAWPSRRVSMVSVELARLSSAEKTSVLGLEIGDAIDVSLALGSGSPSTLRQVRQIDGIADRIDGVGSHVVTFTLGNESTLDWTPSITGVSATVTTATYTMVDGWCEGEFLASATSTAGGGGVEVKSGATGLPTPLTTSALSMGEFAYSDAGTYYVGACYFDGTDLRFITHNTTSNLGAAPSFTVTSGDSLSACFRYPIQQGSSPTLTLKQNNATVASTTTSASYSNRDGLCRAQVVLAATASGTVGTEIKVAADLPAPANTSVGAHGTFVYKQGTSRYEGRARFDGTNIYLRAHNTSGSIGISPSLTVGSGDTLSITLKYRTA